MAEKKKIEGKAGGKPRDVGKPLRAKPQATRRGDSSPDANLSAIDRAVGRLLSMVLGDLAPGARLPSEAKLAAAFGVSRLTIREAVKTLAGRGLIEVARGKRAVVREPDGSAFGDFLAAAMKHDPKGLFDLIEVRQALEIQSAILSAKRLNRASAAAIEGTLAGMREAAGRMQKGPNRVAAERDYHQYDVGFHEALALSSGNRMLAYLLEAIATPLRDSFHLSLNGHKIRGRTTDQTIATHENIFRLVKAGDSRAAAQAMRAHLRDAERDIRAALTGKVKRSGA